MIGRLGALIAVTVLASGCDATMASGPVAPTPPMGALFDVGGHKLALECAGSGTPAVILGHGQGNTRRIWDKVWPDLVRMGRICRYDRAARGDSEVGPAPTTSGRMAHELHDLLRAARVPPPYIMVGHSLGGMNAQLYAHTYPSEVAGLVLVESSSRDYDPRTIAEQDLPQNPEERRLFQGFVDGFDAVQKHYGASPEGVDWDASYQEMAAVTDFGDLPLCVITAGDRTWTAPPFLPRPIKLRLGEVWMAAQRKLVARSRRATHVIAERSGHFVQQERPELVVQAIRGVLAGDRNTRMVGSKP